MQTYNIQFFSESGQRWSDVRTLPAADDNHANVELREHVRSVNYKPGMRFRVTKLVVVGETTAEAS